MLNTNVGTINKQQIRKIHTIVSKLGMDDDEYRLLLSDYWVETSKKLTSAEAEDLITKLEEKAVAHGVWTRMSQRGKLRYEHLKDRKGMASPRQLRMIEAMWKDVTFTHDKHKQRVALLRFVARIAGVGEMEDIESTHARKIIRALCEMKVKRRIHGT